MWNGSSFNQSVLQSLVGVFAAQRKPRRALLQRFKVPQRFHKTPKPFD
jgi:hypothetical protein